MFLLTDFSLHLHFNKNSFIQKVVMKGTPEAIEISCQLLQNFRDERVMKGLGSEKIFSCSINFKFLLIFGRFYRDGESQFSFIYWYTFMVS